MIEGLIYIVRTEEKYYVKNYNTQEKSLFGYNATIYFTNIQIIFVGSSAQHSVYHNLLKYRVAIFCSTEIKTITIGSKTTIL